MSKQRHVSRMSKLLLMSYTGQTVVLARMVPDLQSNPLRRRPWSRGPHLNSSRILVRRSRTCRLVAMALASGNSNIEVVPEPGTLGLLGTGLLGIAGMLHRKFKR